MGNKSRKYRIRRSLPLALLVFLTLFTGGLVYFLSEQFPDPHYYVYPFLLTFIWLIWYLHHVELGKNAIVATFSYDRITVRPYAGFGASTDYFWADFDGYDIKLLQSESRSFEYLNLYINGKKALSFSDFYHENYREIKHTVKGKLVVFRKQSL